MITIPDLTDKRHHIIILKTWKATTFDKIWNLICVSFPLHFSWEESRATKSKGSVKQAAAAAAAEAPAAAAAVAAAPAAAAAAAASDDDEDVDIFDFGIV